MQRKVLLLIVLIIIVISFAFIDPYARRIWPITSVPGSCQEGSIAYSMTLHNIYICKNTGYVSLVSGSAAPINATYITQTPNSILTNEQALSVLATGILKNTTTTGVLSIAASGTDYEVPISFSSPLVRTINSIACPTCFIIPDQTGNNGKYLTTNGSVTSWGTVSAGSPGGINKQVQFNDSATFGGNSSFTFDKSTSAGGLLTLGDESTLNPLLRSYFGGAAGQNAVLFARKTNSSGVSVGIESEGGTGLYIAHLGGGSSGALFGQEAVAVDSYAFGDGYSPVGYYAFLDANGHSANFMTGVLIDSPALDGGSAIEISGLRIQDQTGGTTNYAIHTGAGKVQLGDLTASQAVFTDPNKNLISVSGVNPILSGTTGSIGGGLLAAGSCASGTVAVTNSTTSMTVSISPNTYPGDGSTWYGYVSANGTVTVKVCALVAVTPSASTYNVRVIQ